MKLLLDTDIGGDIDDAVALGYLLRQPRCDLLGVTTVGGQADRRAALASAVCHAAGRAGIPIHVGASQPLLVAERQPDAYQSLALNDRWPHQTFGPDNTAVEFLRNTIRAHPGEITLLTIGPLTNIGLLFALDPEIPAQLAGMMVMGGTFDAQVNDEEWNLICDPHAAAIVMAAPRELTSVGFNVTRHCVLGADECRERFRRAGGPFAFVAEMAEVYFAHEEQRIYFHDPLAAALLFEPSLCATEAQRIEVDVTNPATLGRTRPADQPGTRPHQVAVGVDSARFFEHFFATIGAADA